MTKVYIVKICSLLACTALMSGGCRPNSQWVDLGPNLGGRLIAIVADTSDPSKLLVASPGGGVWRTANNGATWTEASRGLKDLTVLHLERDLLDPRKIWAVTPTWLYTSSDFGGNWTPVGVSAAPATPAWIKTPGSEDPFAFAQLWLTALNSVVLWSPACGGLFTSIDGGTFTHTWLGSGASDLDNCVVSIAADQKDQRFYLSTMRHYRDRIRGTKDAVVWRNKCQWQVGSPCATWESADNGLPDKLVQGLTWLGNSNNLVARIGTGSASIYKTNDGRNWRLASNVPAPSYSARPLIFDSPNYLFLGAVIPHYSTDLGKTWKDFDLRDYNLSDAGQKIHAHADYRAFELAAYSLTKKRYLWGVTDGTRDLPLLYDANIVRFTMDPKVHTAPVYPEVIRHNGLRVWQTYAIAAIRRNSGNIRLIAGSQDNGALCSDDLGKSWNQPGAPTGGLSGDVFSVVVAPSNPDRVYSRSADNNLEAMSNAASAATCAKVQWSQVNAGASPWTVQVPGNLHQNTIAVHPTDADRVYLADDFGVRISKDGGKTATATSRLAWPALVVAVNVDNKGQIFVGTIDGGAWTSTDDGASWKPFGLNWFPPEVIFDVAWSEDGSGNRTYFFATTQGLYRGIASGATAISWKRVLGADRMFVSDIEVDDQCPKRVYAALGFGSTHGQQPGGIVRSTDTGATWTAIGGSSPLNYAPVAALSLDWATSAPSLFAAVYGRGIWTHLESSACP